MSAVAHVLPLMDRRYRETQTDDGRGLGPSQRERSDALVRRHLAAARMGAHSQASYGGSTGGAGSTEGSGAGGLRVFAARQEEQRRQGRIFKGAGSGTLGGRAERAAMFQDR